LGLCENHPIPLLWAICGCRKARESNMAQKQNQPTQHSEQCPNSSLRSLCVLCVSAV